jgi:carbamoyl-phosphate synthase large subunit
MQLTDSGAQIWAEKPQLGAISVLISSVGRRSQLIDAFREALAHLGVTGRVFGIDVCPETAPAGYLVDECFKVSRCTSPTFVDEVLKIAIQNGVELLVPTIDTELLIYAENRYRFLEHGISIAVSDPETVRIACDKAETHRWLSANGFPVPRQGYPEEVLRNPMQWSFPILVKPQSGSASVGIRIVRSVLELSEYVSYTPGLIVEEIAKGDEYTVNVFVQDGHCLCAVPHRRLETRGGEVSKSITVRNERLMSLSCKIAEKLPGARGPLNFQCFVDPNGTIAVIEINARFGGGFPLANSAGAKFPLWLLESQFARKSTATTDWEDGLMMLRYDSAVFIPGNRSTHV